MTDSQAPVVGDIQYMQTFRHDTTGRTEINLDPGPGPTFTSVIDPPRKTIARKYSFESDDDILLSSDEDCEYQLSTSSSSDDEAFINRKTAAARTPTDTTAQTNPMTSKGVKTDVSNPSMTSSVDKTSPLVSCQAKTTSRGFGVKGHSNQSNTFKDVLNEIFEEKPNIPPQNKLGPKPWLMRQNLPKAKKKYEVSNEQFVFKPKPKERKEVQPTKLEPEPNTTQNTTVQVPSEPLEEPKDMYATVPSRDRVSSASSGNALSDNEKSAKYPSEADTGFGSNTSSNPSPSSSSNNVSRLPSREEKVFTSIASDKNNAQELATAALQALSLSKNILQDMEKDKANSRQASHDSDCIYDEVPISPMTSEKKNVYDYVAPQSDTSKVTGDGNRKVISVPVFKPPPAPVRNDKNHPMSSEPIYDISRSNMQTPLNVSNGALDMMYQLFGKDLSGQNPSHGPIGRPASVKSVTFDDEMRQRDQGFPPRPTSRAGSVCSEWSDCTLNISEYPESETSTLPRTTIDIPRYPQVGFQNQNLNNNQHLGFATPQNNPPMSGNNPYSQQFQAMNPNFPHNTDPMRAPFPAYSHTPGLYQTQNNIYAPRNPTFPAAQAPFRHHNPNIPPQDPSGIRSPEYGAYNPYSQYRPIQPPMVPYSRPPMHAFSPPRPQWRGFSPPHSQHDPHRHHREHLHRRGRDRSRGGSRRKPRSHSRSRMREPYYSDDDDFSRSPSPKRHHYRDVIDPEVIASSSYINGYKAALKDAVMTFAEEHGLKRMMTGPKDTKEERMYSSLRRALSAGRIHELPDNVELGHIRKAFARVPDKSYSDDDYDDVIEDDYTIPSAGRPLSRTGSLRSLPGEDRRRRHYRRQREDDDIPDRREMFSSGSEHGESCDCSECEEEYEMRERFHDGELMTSRPTHNVVTKNRREPDDRNESSPRMKGLRQRYIESLEGNSGNIRAPVRANRNGEFDERNQRANDRRQSNFEYVHPRQQNGGFRNGPPNYRGLPEPRMPPHHPQRAPPGDWGRRDKFGYQ